ncbi:MAG: polyprenyl diphosphate synthase [bacterium]
MSKITPKHIAIIMDGNRRWAEKKGLSTFSGHKQGVENVRNIVKVAGKAGIKYLTLYIFSTENWKRDKQEVKYLLNLIDWAMQKYLDEFDNQGAKINIFGDLNSFPKKLQKTILYGIKRLSGNNKIIVNLALNYGARDEILHAIKNLIKASAVTEKEFSKLLYTGQANVPNPDLVIRTGGELRLSNFLLWQAAYSELYFIDKLWPDFSKNDFKKAIDEFQSRKRRFGK